MPNLETFCDHLLASRLMSEPALTAQRAQFPSESAPDFADHLIARNLLTPWQAGKLLEGKYKGFFIDDYKLLELLEQKDRDLRCRAQNIKTGKLVTIQIAQTKFVQATDGTIYSIVEEH